MKLTQKDIQIDEEIPYTPKTYEYGVAEFVICSVFKRGIIRDIYLYPRQQPSAEHFYHLVLGDYKPKSLYFQAYGNDVRDQPWIWVSSWCKEHKCYSLTFYVPREQNTLKFTAHFGDSLTLELHKR